MTPTQRKVIRDKVGLLELAKQLGNVTQACRVLGYSGDSFYRFRDLYGRHLRARNFTTSAQRSTRRHLSAKLN